MRDISNNIHSDGTFETEMARVSTRMETFETTFESAHSSERSERLKGGGEGGGALEECHHVGSLEP